VATLSKQKGKHTTFLLAGTPTMTGLTNCDIQISYELKGSKVNKIITAIKVPTAADSLNKMIDAVAGSMPGPAEELLSVLHFVEIGVTSIPSTGAPASFAWVREIGICYTCWWYSLCNFQYRQHYENTCSYNLDC
jgi:hypothetical protein